jgi:hypothetical protein
MRIGRINMRNVTVLKGKRARVQEEGVLNRQSRGEMAAALTG